MGYTNLALGDSGGRWLSITYGAANSPNDAFSYLPNDPNIVGMSTTALTDFLGSTTPSGIRLVGEMNTEGLDEWGPISNQAVLSVIQGAPLTLRMMNPVLGNLTGGDPTNVLTGTIAYLIL